MSSPTLGRREFLGAPLLVAAARGHAAEETRPDAAWLRDPRFAGVPIGATIDPKNSTGRLHNVHTYFRRELRLDRAPVSAELTVTADDLCKLYINGDFIVQAPEPGYPFAHPLYTLDVTAHLRAGANCLAAHVYYHGCYARAFGSGDNRSGFLLTLDLTFADGTRQRLVTDAGWRCHLPTTFTADHLMGYATQFNENIDLRAEPVGWREPGFDDGAWLEPLIERQDHVFVAALAAPLQHWRAEPVKVEQRGAGRWWLDFGREIVGHPRVRMSGPAGHVAVFRCGEELNADGSVRHNMRCNCLYEDKITLAGDDQWAEFYDYRGFRYVEILNAPARPEVWVDVRHYPFDPDASRFECSLPLLNDIWTISRQGIQMGCQDVFTDCPTREKGQYTGDTYMTVLSQLILTGDPALTRKALHDFQLSQRFDPGLLCVAPGSFRQELTEWSLLWPVMLAYYHQMTGDRDFTVEMVRAGLPSLLAWFAAAENGDGLLAGMDKRKWVLVDWPANLRDNYDYEGTKNGVNTVVNAFYHEMLNASAELLRLAGQDDTAVTARAARLRAAFNAKLLDPASGLYWDGQGSRHQSLHASGFALRFGLVPEARRAAVVELMRAKRLACGLYGAHYFIEGLYQAGEPELAWELLTATDDHSWAEMLRHGATCPLEAWAPDQKWNTSFCHPCGATPVYLLTRYTMGLSPAEPGWRAVAVEPRLPAGLERMSLRIPTVAGPVEADYERGVYRLTVPSGMAVRPAATTGPRLEVRHRDGNRQVPSPPSTIR